MVTSYFIVREMCTFKNGKRKRRKAAARSSQRWSLVVILHKVSHFARQNDFSIVVCCQYMCVWALKSNQNKNESRHINFIRNLIFVKLNSHTDICTQRPRAPNFRLQRKVTNSYISNSVAVYLLHHWQSLSPSRCEKNGKNRIEKNQKRNPYGFIWLSFHHGSDKQLMPIYGLLNARSTALVLFNITENHLSLNRLFILCMKYPMCMCVVNSIAFIRQNVTQRIRLCWRFHFSKVYSICKYILHFFLFFGNAVNKRKRTNERMKCKSVF